MKQIRVLMLLTTLSKFYYKQLLLINQVLINTSQKKVDLGRFYYNIYDAKFQ